MPALEASEPALSSLKAIGWLKRTAGFSLAWLQLDFQSTGLQERTNEDLAKSVQKDSGC